MKRIELDRVQEAIEKLNEKYKRERIEKAQESKKDDDSKCKKKL